MKLNRWTISTRCGSGGCVEVAHEGDYVLVRDSKLGDESPVLVYSPAEWDTLHHDIATGDLPGDSTWRTNGGVAMRKTAGAVDLEFDADEWDTFTLAVHDGEFRTPAGADR